MANYYIAVGPTGNVKGSIAPDPQVVIFDAETPIDMPTHTNAIAISPDGETALVRGNNDRTYRVLRHAPIVEEGEDPLPQIIDLDTSVGTYNVGFHPLTGVEYWINAINTYKVGGVTKPVPTDQTGDYISGQGWVQIYDHGLPGWTDQVGRKIIDAHSLTRCVELGDWIIGMETDARGWILLTNKVTHKWYIAWEGYTPIGPSFVLRAGQPVAGITFPGVEVTQFFALDGSGESVGGPGGTPSTPSTPNYNINLPGLAQWHIRVIATAIIYGPDPKDVPRIPPPPPMDAGADQPGPPVPGSGNSVYGPSEMPNMKYIVDRVFASQTWKLNMGEEYDMRQPDGRGAFTEVAVTAMHDVDARFGHYLRKPRTRYIPKGGSLDSVCFKNDDGITQEGAVIVSNGPQWVPKDRASRLAEGEPDSWVYPAVQ